MTTEQEVVGEETYSAFAESLSNAMSQATGREPVEEVEEEDIEEIEDDTEEVDATEEVVEEPKEEEEFKLIPKEWSKKEKESFEQALEDPNLKTAAETFIGRYENLKKDYYKKATETAEMRKSVSEWDDVFDESAKGALQARGINETEYVKRLLNVERQLISNPVDTIKKLTQAYGVDIKQLVGDATEDDGVIDYDKTISEMKKELNALKSKESQTKNQAAAQNEANVAKQVKDFQFAVDETGELMYPHFKEVKDEMGILLQNGKAATLEEAYNMSPTIKEMMLEQKQELKTKADIEEEKRKVARAKKASKGVHNKKTAAIKTEGKISLEDRLKAKFAEARGS